jgi:biopolymer transport protein ExbD
MSTTKENEGGPQPSINVTPLIDVLLVLLIIFMVAVPLRPSRFVTKVPEKPDDNRQDLTPNVLTLVVTILPDRTLRLNSLSEMGSVDDTSKLSSTLATLFDQRKKNRVFRSDMLTKLDQSEDSRVEKTVFIKAPRGLVYGDVVKVIDGLKGAGASPIGLQIDGLN